MGGIRTVYRRFAGALGMPRYITASAYSFLCINPPLWDIFDRAGSTLYREYPPQLDEVQQRIASGLTESGVAVAHLDELLPGTNSLSDMIEYLKMVEGQAEGGMRKPFLQYHLGEFPLIDLENPFVRFSLDPRVLGIVNSYMSTCSKLIFFALNTTNVVSPGASPMASQRWHRDAGLRKLTKIFLYINDVEEDGGPFTYVVRSHRGGNWRRLFPQKQFGRHGVYPPDGAVDNVVSKSDVKPFTGRAGTVIFCDTTGLHKGGYSISKPRIMYTSVYTTKADVQPALIRYPLDFESRITSLNPVTRYAVTNKPHP